MADDDLQLPAFLDRRLSEADRAAAAALLPAPILRERTRDPLEERMEASRMRDAEVAAMLAAGHEQRERMRRAASLAALTDEHKETAVLNRKLKKWKPKSANAAAAKPRKRRANAGESS